MDLDSRQLIDAQFDRAVEIVQGLPKTGPIQTGYEEKLDMYSLYKQATVGNVQGPRPNVWDMLGRAKWDAWAKHKDLDPYEAKWLYVDALLKVLRKYSDKTVARDLVRELESYAGDPANLVMSGVSAHSPGSSSSSSSATGDMPSSSLLPPGVPALAQSHHLTVQHDAITSDVDDETTTDEEDEADDVVPPAITTPHAASQLNRPQSSLSSRPYRTPMASTLLVGSPPPMNVPHTQPHPGFHTQSAFAESATSIPSSVYPTTSVSYPEQLARSPPSDPAPSVHGYPSRAGFRPTAQTPYRQFSLQSAGAGVPPRPASIPMLERAVESVQVHLAAITERLETLEGLLHHSSSTLSASGLRSPVGRRSPFGGGSEVLRWDIEDMGMWSLVLQPLARAVRLFRQLMALIANSENRSPTFVIIRRLFLDISFVLCFLAVFKLGWRRSGVRRREVSTALQGLWRAIVGHQAPRHMVERGV
ncbi:ACBP-domain-containing protein [Lentinus tigrinus ALCF2SS1-7]|uniref:ACBP-domain-containing protein n=1 Tax=Lentinus tigrinus ALCF2SS1-6 TaxID=1328759 RepID=A0A5C2SSS8_9APHY|nr:ACBP-domain-containing protein [Lentinus tigrinus ALCF2SS1-6]RPD80642.1 ACBP-domain-containing protein [Lentinus tigrinus ALCF2SS1-7]